MADQLLTIRRNRYPPRRIGRWNEVVQRVVQLANQLAEPMELVVRQGRQGVGQSTGNELQNVPTTLIAP
jgi:hypothetical protein